LNLIFQQTTDGFLSELISTAVAERRRGECALRVDSCDGGGRNLDLQRKTVGGGEGREGHSRDRVDKLMRGLGFVLKNVVITSSSSSRGSIDLR
jgi:hypothetical protein